MLLEGAQLKPLRDDVESELRKVTETLLGEDFVWLRGFPDSAQQYWQYELTIYEETRTLTTCHVVYSPVMGVSETLIWGFKPSSRTMTRLSNSSTTPFQLEP